MKKYTSSEIFVRIATFLMFLWYSIDLVFLHFFPIIIDLLGTLLSFYSTIDTIDELFDYRFRKYVRRNVLKNEKSEYNHNDHP